METKSWLENHGHPEIRDRVSAEAFLRRPEVNWGHLEALGCVLPGTSSEVAEQVEIQMKYEGYIKRDLMHLESVKRSEGEKIPSTLNYDDVSGLSNEVRGRLKETRPETLGQMSRIQGITPAAVANLLIYMKTKGRASREMVT